MIGVLFISRTNYTPSPNATHQSTLPCRGNTCTQNLCVDYLATNAGFVMYPTRIVHSPPQSAACNLSPTSTCHCLGHLVSSESGWVTWHTMSCSSLSGGSTHKTEYLWPNENRCALRVKMNATSTPRKNAENEIITQCQVSKPRDCPGSTCIVKPLWRCLLGIIIWLRLENEGRLTFVIAIHLTVLGPLWHHYTWMMFRTDIYTRRDTHPRLCSMRRRFYSLCER